MLVHRQRGATLPRRKQTRSKRVQIETSRSKLGILAGGGAFPGRVIADCLAGGRPFFVLALEGITSADAVAGAPHAWIRIGQGGRMFKLLRRHGVEELVIVGTIRRVSLWRLRPDLFTIHKILRLALKLGFGFLRFGDDRIIKIIIAEVERLGLRVVGIETVLGGLLATAGPYGAARPDKMAQRDIALGIEAAREVGSRDVGQGVVVRGGQVLAREDEQGTDAMLARCVGALGEGSGGVLVKVSKPGQQRKVDLPAIGVDTVREAKRAGLAGIAIESDGALVIDRAGVIEAADRAGIFVIGVEVDR
ncbi:MAG: LpxI family protein [Alphaproteobacteria bacterium]